MSPGTTMSNTAPLTAREHIRRLMHGLEALGNTD